MWNTDKQKRFDNLWEQKFNDSLTQSEQMELDCLLSELDQLEALLSARSHLQDDS
jgi:hypothetical protein